MVGYDPHSVQLSQAEYVAAGGISGAVSRAVAQPLDVLKIRFQLQIEPIKTLSSSKYHGVIQAVGKIVQEEGLGALWKGHVPAQGLSILYGLTQFAMFELLTKHVGSRYPQACSTNLLPLTHFVCGAMSSSLTTFVVQPIDVLRTRFVAQGEPKMYTSVRSAAVTICKKESFFALYRGLSPALICVAPQMGLQFGFYALLTSIWKAVSGRSEADRPGPVESLVCGSGAGVLSKLIVFPLDLVKKRLQVQGMEAARVGFGETRRYRGLLHCLRECVRGEGVGGAYKGLTPSLMKAAVVAGIHLSVYEQVCQLFALRYH